MKNKIAGAAIKEFVESNPKMYSFLLDDRSKHKKAWKKCQKNVVVEISYSTKLFCWIMNV